MSGPQRPSLSDRLRAWARRFKRDGVTLWMAWRDRRTPLAVKLLCGLVVAYALSPIDLVPDVIPVLGYLDDVLLLPGLIWLATRLLPREVLDDSRQAAEAWLAANGRKPVLRAGALLVVAVWLAVLALAGWWWFR